MEESVTKKTVHEKSSNVNAVCSSVDKKISWIVQNKLKLCSPTKDKQGVWRGF